MHSILKTSALFAALSLAAACGSKSDKKDDAAPTPPPAGDQKPTDQPAADQPAATDGAALVTEFCAGCHAADRAAGGITLDPATVGADVADKAKEEVDEGEMPPSRAKKQPSAEQRAAISAFFASKL